MAGSAISISGRRCSPRNQMPNANSATCDRTNQNIPPRARPMTNVSWCVGVSHDGSRVPMSISFRSEKAIPQNAIEMRPPTRPPRNMNPGRSSVPSVDETRAAEQHAPQVLDDVSRGHEPRPDLRPYRQHRDGERDAAGEDEHPADELNDRPDLAEAQHARGEESPDRIQSGNSQNDNDRGLQDGRERRDHTEEDPEGDAHDHGRR